MGELRDRMVRDMDVRRFSGRTVEAYVAGVKGLAKYFMRPPDQLSDEEVQRYLLHLREERQLSASTCNQIRCALKFFYEVTVRRPQASVRLAELALTGPGGLLQGLEVPGIGQRLGQRYMSGHDTASGKSDRTSEKSASGEKGLVR